jgi:hypothetical protein
VFRLGFGLLGAIELQQALDAVAATFSAGHPRFGGTAA